MPLTKAYWRILKPFSTKSKLEKQSSNSFWTILQHKVKPFHYFCISYNSPLKIQHIG